MEAEDTDHTGSPWDWLPFAEKHSVRILEAVLLFPVVFLLLAAPFQGQSYPRGTGIGFGHPAIPLIGGILAGIWGWRKGLHPVRYVVLGLLVLFNAEALWALGTSRISGELVKVEVFTSLTSRVEPCVDPCFGMLLSDTWALLSVPALAYVLWPRTRWRGLAASALIFLGLVVFALGRNGLWEQAAAWQPAPLWVHFLSAAMVGLGVSLLDLLGGVAVAGYTALLVPQFAVVQGQPLAYPTPWQDPSLGLWVLAGVVALTAFFTWRWMVASDPQSA